MNMPRTTDAADTLSARRPAPCAEEPCQDAPLALVPPALTILLVEDDGELLELTKEIVAHWGWPVRLLVAGNGSDGLRQAGVDKPVVIVTDLMMPDMDGFQMLKKLVEMQDLHVSRTVVVTGMDDQQINAHGGVPAGVEVLHKPIPYERLKEIVLTSTMFMPAACARTLH